MADIWNSTAKYVATNALEILWREFRRHHSKAREALLLLAASQSDDTDDTPYSDNDSHEQRYNSVIHGARPILN